MTTEVVAALQWTGERFVTDEVPTWLAEALGSGNIVFDGVNLTVAGPDDPLTCAPTEWVFINADDEFGKTTNVDFLANYEIAE